MHNQLTPYKLALSENKIEYMVIGSYQKIPQIANGPQITIGNDRVKLVATIPKVLGLCVGLVVG